MVDAYAVFKEEQMRYDTFFSISQTPVDGKCPPEKTMFKNFFDQVIAADALGYETAWIAEAHLSSEVQKGNKQPVIPHWQGEVGLMNDLCQMAHVIFSKTKQIEVGSAIMNILCNGGPIAAAEKISTFLALHGLDESEARRIHVGFSGGRFEYQNRPYGIVPRDPVEEAAWPALRGQIFSEAGEIFCRLLAGETISSDDISKRSFTRANFRSDEDWARVQEAAGGTPDEIPITPRYTFEKLKTTPSEYRRELLQLVAGTHDKKVQVELNQHLPVRVFNLSITQPEIIEQTHLRLKELYHKDGGEWKRDYMPRTTFVFLNADPELSKAKQSEAAAAEAKRCLGAYWNALEGTMDPRKIDNAAKNALIGNPEEVADQVLERFHPDDRLMLWFDFFNHDSQMVIDCMTHFMEQVVPIVEGKIR
jgi:alkanesulfonate monooxygenase SsuD/methylene tetrahydromethanopterin reductase-like flavin-dependent oxidoreductase (luciferase family)